MSFLAQFERFHEIAAEAVGAGDFGAPDYREPMQRLLADYDRYPQFSEIGVAATTGEVIGKLAGRLIAQQGFLAHPQFASQPITRPIFIIGMPRTGTTALHRLITEDPDTQALELWLGAMPMPRPPRETWAQNPLFQQVAQQIEQLYALSPGLKRMHPVYADQADECRFAMDQTFWSTGNATTATVPDYAQWCLHADARYAYRHYQRILGLIAGNDSRRWVLKNPDHIFALDALLEVFPDACIVQTHREPAVSLSSVASMSYEVMRLREPQCTPAQHGRDLLIWAQALEKAETVRRAQDPSRFFDLHIDQFQADAIGSVERIYAHFGLPVSEAARAAWTQRATRDPRAGHGKHRYGAQEFGVSASQLREIAPLYHQRYAALAETRH